MSPTNILAPLFDADPIFDLSRFVLIVTAAVFIAIFSLLAYAIVKVSSDGYEPVQVYGSTQLKLAWTVIQFLLL